MKWNVFMGGLRYIFYQSAVCLFAIFMLIQAAMADSMNTARLAIVIDDIGYRQKEDNAIYALPSTITVAIIPSAPFAHQRALQARMQNRDVIIHMPMQPKDGIKIEKGGLTLGLSAEEVAKRVDLAQKILPNAIGMNNHMGSVATSNRLLMTHLMQHLAEKHLFFLDSRTIGSSVAAKVAKQYGVKALERHIFLDASDEYNEVEKQFQQAIRYARKHGLAIMIGHPRKNTISVLYKELAKLPKDIQLVSLGSVWRDEKVSPKRAFTLFFSDIPAPSSIPPFTYRSTLRGLPE